MKVFQGGKCGLIAIQIDRQIDRRDDGTINNTRLLFPLNK